MDEMRKITKNTLGSEDKMVMFWLIVDRIASNRKNTMCVLGGLRVVSQKIKKSTINFEDKVW